MPQKEDVLKKFAEERMKEMFGEKNGFRGLNAYFPKTKLSKGKQPIAKKSTVDKKPAVAKMTMVVDEDTILQKIGAFLTSTPQLVYLRLYRLTSNQGRTITDWLGYTEIARQCNISHRTTQRAIEVLLNKGLIERIEVKNEKDLKGSRYKINLPR